MTHRGPFQPRIFCDSVINNDFCCPCSQRAPRNSRRARAGVFYFKQEETNANYSLEIPSSFLSLSILLSSQRRVCKLISGKYLPW